MKRCLLLTVGWLLCAAGLYAAVVALEFYWNAWDWQPSLDLTAWGLLVAIFAFLIAMRLLASASNDRFSQTVSLLLCLILFGLGCYTISPEPLTEGLFARYDVSPTWYRCGRLAVLSMPSVVWALGHVCRRHRCPPALPS